MMKPFFYTLSNKGVTLQPVSYTHLTALSLISIVLVGVLMALYMLKTDNIWGVAALHGAWNFTQGNLVGVAVSGQNAGGTLLHFQARSGVPDWLSLIHIS